jgi:hypothetical protein
MQESATPVLDTSIETRKTSRRVFLGAAGAAVMTAASYVRVLGANDRIGIGVIGFGLIGKQHITDLKKFDDVEMLGMCDVYKPRLEEGLAYMASPRAKGYSDFRRMYVMNAKGPTLVTSIGGRYVLEDDGETPDLQDAIWAIPGPDGSPGFTVYCAIREANAGRRDTAAMGLQFLGTKGTMVLAGNWEVFPENKIDPVNDIPRFSGHPVGGPVYTDTKPSPWIEASKGGGAESDPRYGFGGEDTLAMNKRDWLNSMRTRKRPFCEVEDGHRVAIACNLANMSLRLGRSIRWDPEKEEVIGDKEAAAMCVKKYRAPWDSALKSAIKI